MNTNTKKLMAILVLSVLGVVGLTACEKKGPAEQLGEKVDEAAQDVKRGVEDATD